MAAAAANNDPSPNMRDMLDLAKELAHDGTVEGTIKALELVTNMIRCGDDVQCVCMCVCMLCVCMYVCMYVCMELVTNMIRYGDDVQCVCMYVVCMYVCMYVRMYVCMYGACHEYDTVW
jgi:hypothetical protein